MNKSPYTEFGMLVAFCVAVCTGVWGLTVDTYPAYNSRIPPALVATGVCVVDKALPVLLDAPWPEDVTPDMATAPAVHPTPEQQLVIDKVRWIPAEAGLAIFFAFFLSQGGVFLLKRYVLKRDHRKYQEQQPVPEKNPYRASP